jgi:hypothetical protein
MDLSVLHVGTEGLASEELFTSHQSMLVLLSASTKELVFFVFQPQV